MKPLLLELTGVGKDFVSVNERLRVLESVDLRVAAGETMAVTGPSGSGKSTLLAIMAGLESPSAGQVCRDGTPAGDWNEERLARWRRRRVGFVFQSFRLAPTLTALENAALPLELLGELPREAEVRARELLETLGLKARLDHYPSELSGGEQQRVAIARAYAHRPTLILADEPTGSLDRATAGQVLKSLIDTHQAAGSALVVVTHDPHVANALGRVVRLDSGRIIP